MTKQYSIEEALDLLKEYIDDVGGCDHDVNICVCFDYTVYDAAVSEIHALRQKVLNLQAQLIDLDYSF